MCVGLAGQVSEKPTTVFITIYKSDRDWVNETKAKGQNREERLHQVLEKYRAAIEAGVI